MVSNRLLVGLSGSVGRFELRAPVGIPLVRTGSLLFPNRDTDASGGTVDYFGFVTPLGTKDLLRANGDGQRRSKG